MGLVAGLQNRRSQGHERIQDSLLLDGEKLSLRCGRGGERKQRTRARGIASVRVDCAKRLGACSVSCRALRQPAMLMRMGVHKDQLDLVNALKADQTESNSRFIGKTGTLDPNTAWI